MQQTNISLDPEQVRALSHMAVEERRSVEKLVRRAVDNYSVLVTRGPMDVSG